ncbi:MAG: CvpA family protein [Eubacteriales bacterium]
MSWIDILVIFIIAGAAIKGYVRGLVLTLTSIISFVMSIIIAGVFYKDISGLIILNTKIDDAIYSFITEHIGVNDSGYIDAWANGSQVNNIPQGAKGYIDNVIIENTHEIISQDISYTLSQMLIHIMVFIAIFLAVKLLFYFTAHIIDVLFKLPVLNFFNKTGGGIIGMLEGAILSVVIISLLYTVAIFVNYEALADALNNSNIAHLFYLGYIFY